MPPSIRPTCLHQPRPSQFRPGMLLMAALWVPPLLGVTGQAEGNTYRILNISETPNPSREPAIAAASDRTIVAWEEAGPEVISRGIHGDIIDPPADHGPGQDPALSSIPGHVFLAYALGDEIHIRDWNGQEWSDPVVLESQAGHQTFRPEFGGGLDPPGAPLYLIWSEERRSIETDIWFTEWVGGVWQAPLRVRERIMGFAASVCAQVEPKANGSNVEPRIYWIGDGIEILYMERQAGQWLDPFPVPGSFGGAMEIAAAPDGRHHLLANGPQPTCPCNVMLYTAETAAGWSAPENIMVPMDEFTWPRYPALRVDGSGVVHAFWYQSAYDFMMQPSGEAMFYFTRDGGAWQDQSALLESHIGIDNALSVDDPQFAWVEGDTGSEEVFAAVPDLVSSVGPETGAPPSPRDMSVFPNPFSGAIRIAVSGIDGGPPRLDVFDVAGRRVAAVRMTGTAGAKATGTWNGRDARGLPCPAGEYWLVVPSAAEPLVSRVTLVR